MAESTGPLLVAGGIAFLDHKEKQGSWDFKIPVATGLAVWLFSLGEDVNAEVVKLLAWLVLVGELTTSSAVQDFASWFKGGAQISGTDKSISPTMEANASSYIATHPDPNLSLAGTETLQQQGQYLAGVLTATK
jgi:hypothetical protein